MKKVLSLMLLLLVTALLFVACSDDDEDGGSTAQENFVAAFALTQVNEEQRFAISWSSEESIEELTVEVKHGDQVVADKTFTEDDLEDNEVFIDAYYGKHQVAITAKNEDGVSCSVTQDIALSASEYVIAPISGSMPQLYFTLNMKEITENYTLPTFVWLARPGSWNWDQLPDNVYAMPTVAFSEVMVHNNYDRMVEVTDAYIEELYSINANAKFNLYINDFNSYLYLKLLVGNGIPEENYYVTLLSDGGASYTAFNSAFNSEDASFDADAKYSDMVSKLNTLYQQVKTEKDYYWSTETFAVDTTTFKQYAYVAAKEKDNVEWWLLRPRKDQTLFSPDTDFIDSVISNVNTAPYNDTIDNVIVERNFAAPLSAMTDQDKATLKALYNFNDEMFAEAQAQNKKAMMILGSWANATNEPDFEDYVKLVKAYYGEEDFVYYYKGHPSTPTSNYPDKQEQLERLGLIDVESSINAELILFFYPDIYMCGYNSSTFLSVESKEMACAMFAQPESSGLYVDLIGMYITKIVDPASSAYAQYCTESTHTYYLMEFNQDTKAEFGIYDATANTLQYYPAN